jgi:hypothetical protein
MEEKNGAEQLRQGATYVPGFWSWNGVNSTVLMSAMIKEECSALERVGSSSDKRRN